jgi:hypothetical protein
MSARRPETIETPIALPPARPFDVKIHWTDGEKRQISVIKVMAGDWARAIDLAMRSVRSDKIVPMDARVTRVVP